MGLLTKHKTNKKIISASAMLLISAAMLGTATYAWFTMNKEVEVTGMQVKAKAEQGLLINEVADYSDSNWDNEATNNQSEGIRLHATSTANTGTWYVAYSSKANSSASAASGQASEDLSSGYFTQLKLLRQPQEQMHKKILLILIRMLMQHMITVKVIM